MQNDVLNVLYPKKQPTDSFQLETHSFAAYACYKVALYRALIIPKWRN